MCSAVSSEMYLSPYLPTSCLPLIRSFFILFLFYFFYQQSPAGDLDASIPSASHPTRAAATRPKPGLGT